MSLDQLQKEIDVELQKLSDQPPLQEEFQAAVNGWEAGFTRKLQSIGGFGGKADLLNQYNTLVGSPDYIKEDMNRYLSVTPESVQKVLRDFIKPERVIIYVTPEGDLKVDETMVPDRTQKPLTGPVPKLALPSWEEKTLSNGLKVRVTEQHELPLIQFNLLVKAGVDSRSGRKAGSFKLDIRSSG